MAKFGTSGKKEEEEKKRELILLFNFQFCHSYFLQLHLGEEKIYTSTYSLLQAILVSPLSTVWNSRYNSRGSNKLVTNTSEADRGTQG